MRGGEGAWPGCSSRLGYGAITRCGGLCCQVLQVQRWVVPLGAGLDGASPALRAGLTRASPVLCTGPDGAFPVLGSGLEGSSPALGARWGRTSPVLAAMLIGSFSVTPSQSGWEVLVGAAGLVSKWGPGSGSVSLRGKEAGLLPQPSPTHPPSALCDWGHARSQSPCAFHDWHVTVALEEHGSSLPMTGKTVW